MKGEIVVKCERCLTKHQKWLEKQSKYAQIGQEELERFRVLLKEGKASLVYHKHELKREYFRAISEQDTREVLENGWVIERNIYNKEISTEQGIKKITVVNLVILYYIKLGQGRYRPIHLVINFKPKQPDKWMAITIYDPRSMSWKWSDDFTERVCFCKPND